jgi:hypothetical protein
LQPLQPLKQLQEIRRRSQLRAGAEDSSQDCQVGARDFVCGGVPSSGQALPLFSCHTASGLSFNCGHPPKLTPACMVNP